MARIQMTYELAMAAAKDAANSSARKGHRSIWNDEDYTELVSTFHRLLPCPNDVPCEFCHD